MEKHLVPFAAVPQLAKTDVSYATGDPALRPFYVHQPSLDAFNQVVEARQAVQTPRETLVKALTEQYRDLPREEAVWHHLTALQQDNVWTITTAHQPALLTGPLYFIYKAITTIRLAQEAEKILGAPHRVVPVFVLGSEDHDLDELNHARLFGKTLEWHPGLSGPVGVMPSDSLAPVLAELKDILGASDDAVALYQRVEEAYAPGVSFAVATRRLLHALLGRFGLLVLGMDTPEMKRHFIPVMRDELLEHTAHRLVSESIGHLETQGFKAQAPPREINLFYMKPGLRERIVQTDDGFSVLHTDLHFTREGLLTELEAHPEYFSPNVVLRPLYQEMMLPNLAYVGGGGELAYWLERRRLFEHYSIPYPMLVRRNSVLIMDKDSAKKRQKFGFEMESLFGEADTLVRRFVDANASVDLSLHQESEAIKNIYGQIAQKALGVDPTLEKALLADGVKAQAALMQWESRLHRAEKQRHEVTINQIRGLKDKLFPGVNGLQERSDNVLPYLLKYGDGFLDTLMENLHPFDPGFVILDP
ncbi:MAG: bacillithiol biosynthesis cysteine-adding enzyme BshC [Saprospiraceae bacterium]